MVTGQRILVGFGIEQRDRIGWWRAMGLPFLRFVDRGILNLAEAASLRETFDAWIVQSIIKGGSVQCVQGFGGFFFRAKDPGGLPIWTR